MDDLERVQARLEHLRSVQPILGALRTISLASWRTALRRRERIQRYRDELSDVLAALPSELRRDQPGRPEMVAGLIILVIGSERGLCGQYNVAVADHADAYLHEQLEAGRQFELAVLGSRTSRLLQRRQWSPDWWGKLSLTTLPSYGLALDLASQWLARFRAGEIDGVDVIFNDYRGIGQYQPTIRHLLPPHLPGGELAITPGPWPPPIIETDPVSLVEQVTKQWTAVDLYDTIVESAVAEHSARYQLMEGATQNADRLIDELTLAVQNARKQAITREMQELAAGAGLVRTRDT
jgi:F-type H+-transporting ATPase subunit gamma